jgi:4'-phosphopantetheinyl transferase
VEKLVLELEEQLNRLSEQEICVSAALLDEPPSVVATLRLLLSADEIARAERFRFERDRDRYVVGRASLRHLLGSYLDVSPESLRFSYSRHRKPALLEPRTNLSFNLSHSDDLALYAVCLDAEIGIDVERFRPEPSRDRVPEHFFSPREIETLRSLTEAAQAAAFLKCWTRKEAFLKARGDGLTLQLDSFDVTLTDDEHPRLLRTAWDRDEAASWSLHDLTDSFPGYVASLAVRGADWSISINPRGWRRSERSRPNGPPLT